MEANESDSPSSRNQEISSTTQKIVNEIKVLEKELEGIQNSCLHQRYSFKNCPNGLDNAFSLRKVCDDCQLEIGYPSQEEINKWVTS
jgi:hypothetical protein